MCDVIVHVGLNGPAHSIPLVCKLFFSRAEILYPHKAMLMFVMLNLMCQLVDCGVDCASLDVAMKAFFF